jgi:1-acyl-sn-glycerol-3-phosphate acyltransferase
VIWKFLAFIIQRPWFYWFARSGFLIYARVVLGLRIEGTEHVPRTGGLVVACNHISALDPPLVAASLPRQVSFMAKQELFEKPFSRILFLAMRAYPVNRSGRDVSSIKRSLELLGAGGAIGIFIQGTRNPGEIAALNGAAFLAQRAGAPLQPTAVWREGRRFHVRFGPVLQSAEGGLSRDALTQELTAAINELLPEGSRMLSPV